MHLYPFVQFAQKGTSAFFMFDVTKIAGRGSPEAPRGGHSRADGAFQKCFKNQHDIGIGVVVVTLVLHFPVVRFYHFAF